LRYPLKAGVESRLGNGLISEGNIDGKAIEFKFVAGGLAIVYDGTVSGDEIHMTETLGTQKTTFVLKRIKYDK